MPASRFPNNINNNYDNDVLFGNIPHAGSTRVSGKLVGVSQTEWQTVWGGATTLNEPVFQTSSQRLLFTTSDAGDIGSVLLVDGITTDGSRQVEILPLTGLTTPTLNVYTFLNRVFLVGGPAGQVGTLGNITITYEISGDIANYMEAGIGKTVNAFFRIPIEINAIIKRITYTISKNDIVSIRVLSRAEPTSPFVVVAEPKVGSNTINVIPVDQGIPAGSDIIIQAKAVTPNATITADVVLDLEVKQNVRPIV